MATKTIFGCWRRRKTKAENKALKAENEKLKTQTEGLIDYYNASEEKMKALWLELDEVNRCQMCNR
uniref:Uncharacterized protein n=1 Tax=Oryza punctata TaxID=4537 RepID=A0A0E0LB81_ORYPU